MSSIQMFVVFTYFDYKRKIEETTTRVVGSMLYFPTIQSPNFPKSTNPSRFLKPSNSPITGVCNFVFTVTVVVLVITCKQLCFTAVTFLG